MRLSKWGYHADFLVYPCLIAACATGTLLHPTAHSIGQSIAAIGMGLMGWTAIEYGLHRWVLHRVPLFFRLHGMHHAHPGALIGTPTWISAPLFLLLGLLVASQTSASVAGGLTTGLMLGYLAYAWVHHSVHHRRARPGSWLYHAKLRHARHHRAGASSDFGVSSGVWDAILQSTSGPSPQSTEPRCP